MNRTVQRKVVEETSDDDASKQRANKRIRLDHFTRLKATAGSRCAPRPQAGVDDDDHPGVGGSQHSDSADVAPEHSADDGRVPGPQRSHGRSRAQDNERRHEGWERLYPKSAALSFTWAGSGGATLGADIAEQMRHDLARRVRRCLEITCPACPACGRTAGGEGADTITWLPWLPAGAGGAGAAAAGLEADVGASGSDSDSDQASDSGSMRTRRQGEIYYVTQQGSVTVPLPVFRCSHCCTERCIDPAEVGCFPSSPKRPSAWFDVQLLRHVQHLREENPTAAAALSKALHRDHADIGHQTPMSVLEAVASAAGHWARVMEMRDSTLLPGAAGDTGRRWAECPACSRTCIAISGDCCMGLRRFRAAAGASMQLKPLSAGALFVSEEDVVARLEERDKLAQADTGMQLGAAACSEFKAAKASSSRTAHYDRQGVAAVVCRHGFCLSMASLMTPENFVYYELLLEAAAAKLDLASLRAVFLDVACKFEGYYGRIRTASMGGGGASTSSASSAAAQPQELPPLTFAIGPWHIKPHKAECQVRYNSRLMEGLGLTFGDLIEHLWADIRRHWYITAYMSPAARQDYVTMLVKHRHLKKEDTLAAQLLANVQRAVRERADIESRLAQMKPEDAKDANTNPREEFLRGRAAQADTASSNSGRPSILGRPPWTRAYLKDLETFYLLKPLTKGKTTKAAEGNPQRYSALKGLAAAEERLRRVEEKRGIVRWPQDGPEDKDRIDVGWASVWVKLGAQWVTGLLYMWTLLAPALFPDRDFS